ncbi:helix-turn-helix domain-containing protein [Candidatus Berkelbacteria bacterium]|nr:helix-turn-helix domain-containing protein [Candidatus Berkelbacteria bacterium]
MNGFRQITLTSLPRLATRLVKLRQRRSFSLADLEEKSRVKKEYLLALEESRFNDLPGEVYAFSFLKAYLAVFEVPSAPYLNLLRTELCWLAKQSSREVALRPPSRVKEPFFTLTPKTLSIGLIVFFVVGVLGYIWWGVKDFANPPPLFVQLPTENKTNASEILLAGQTASFANLFINQQPVPVAQDGRFEQKIKLAAGLNTIEVVATNRLNKETKKVIQVLAEIGG